MKIIREIDLTYIEKEAMRIFLKMNRNFPVILLGAQELANHLDVSRPRAYAILTKLVDKGFLIKIERKGFTLSKMGTILLNELQHRMKILEVFCHDDLGMSLEKATKEAAQMVLNVSYDFIETMCARLGKPVTCPHDTIIPHH